MSHPFEYQGDVTLSFGVKDMGASIEWYQDTLGFEVLYRLDDMGWCEMQGPGANITVGLGQREDVQKGGGCVPVWGVKDIAATRSFLESKKVQFDGDTQEIPGMVKLATFFDPDGNAMMLAQSLMNQ
ncbi:MAG: VOC family protein [Candidatus Eisenbacteria bacterium]